MFSTFFRFELRYWLRGWMVWIFTGIITLMILLAASIDNIQVGQAVGNTTRNAPYTIQMWYMVSTILACVMVAAFVNNAASRDFAYDTHQLIFTKPMNKMGYLMGRFWGSVLISMIPMLGASVGVILAEYMPWAAEGKWGAISWGAHLWGILCFVVPNAIFVGCVVFAIAVWTRSTMASFLGVLGVIICTGLANIFVANLDNEALAVYVNPFGASAFGVMTRYWTVSDKNTQFVTMTGYMLGNRAIWLSVGFLIMAATCWRFSFSTGIGTFKRFVHNSLTEVRSIRPNVPVLGALVAGGLRVLTAPIAMLFGYRHNPVDQSATVSQAVAVPRVTQRSGFGASISQLLSQIRMDFFGTIKSPIFIVVMVFGIFDTFMSLQMRSSEGYGNSALPVTYSQINAIRGSLYFYLICCMTFYAGVVVWKERDAKLDEIYDALPHRTWISFLGKLIALMLIILCVVGAAILVGMFQQAINGYTRFQPMLYFQELIVNDFAWLFSFIVLAMLVHVVSPNKYVGYFAFVILLIANTFAWDGAGIQTALVKYGQIPNYTYSDMYRFAPFATALQWFSSYWVLFACLLCTVAMVLWVRGRERGFFKRLNMAMPRWRGGLRIASLLFFALWAGSGAWAYYNTKVLNSFKNEDEQTALQVRYEKEYKDNSKKPQPRITKVRYDIDIYPKTRHMTMKGDQTLVNKEDEPIDTIFVVVADNYETEVNIDGATLKANDEEVNYRAYAVDPPMQPGEERRMQFSVDYKPVGFENSVSVPQIVQNGTFFNNGIAPQIGYQEQYEITDRDDREEHGLGEPIIALPLNPDNIDGRRNTYISNNSDWVEVETFISTSSDQIAIAPGSLQEAPREENGRRHYHYKVDHPSLNFYSFISADYEVKTSAWGDVDLEVYYHKDHHWNVDKMLNSMKKSLAYYSENFGEYKHKQARIIEFPRVASFAQAFPGTMPYSEGIGFIADIKKIDDIDMVFYVVAHEMAHQWWAHQVVGANMRGATLLSETMAQYSALMVMEKEYGRDMMRKFLKYEMDNYLRNRGSEQLDERPLMEVEPTQGYVHYRKGSVIMYHLKELIGEDKVNAALRSVVEKFGYQKAPYPTSVDLVDALREQCPPEYHGVLTDSFKKITLFGNRTTEATYKKRDDGKYDVTINVDCHKFQANSKGLETEVELNDWIEIGAFASPPSGRRFGETLHRERVHITKAENTFTFTVDELPNRAGVDPFSLLIDRVPADNMRKPIAE